MPADRSSLEREAAELSSYHTIELADGVVTDGWIDVRPHVHRYGLPERMDGSGPGGRSSSATWSCTGTAARVETAQGTPAGTSSSRTSTRPSRRSTSRRSSVPAPKCWVDSAPQATPKARHSFGLAFS